MLNRRADRTWQHGGTVGPGTGRSAPTARRSSETGIRRPASWSPNDDDIRRASGSARDEQASNVLMSRQRGGVNGPSSSSLWQPWRISNGAFSGLAEKPFAELTLEMKLSAKQLYSLLVNTVQGKALTLVRSAEKHHGIQAWRRIKTEYQTDAA